MTGRPFDEILKGQVQAARIDRSSGPAVAVCEELAQEGRFSEFALLLRAWVALRPHQKEALLALVPGIIFDRYVRAGHEVDGAATDAFIQSQPELADRVRADCFEPHLLPAAANALRDVYAASLL